MTGRCSRRVFAAAQSASMKLWPVGKVIPIRFHDTRHTTASLLMMFGANPAAVQRILRHSDIRVTMDVYGHLAPGYLRTEIDRLSFRPKSSGFTSPVLQGSRDADPGRCRPPPANDSSELTWSGREDSNLRHPAPKAGALPGCATPRCEGG